MSCASSIVSIFLKDTIPLSKFRNSILVYGNTDYKTRLLKNYKNLIGGSADLSGSNNTKTKYSKDSIVRIWRQIFQASTKLQEIDRPIIDSKRSINLINTYKGGKSSISGKDNIIKLSSKTNAKIF